MGNEKKTNLDSKIASSIFQWIPLPEMQLRLLFERNEKRNGN